MMNDTTFGPSNMCNLLGQTWGEILDLTLLCAMLFLIGTDVYSYLIVSFVKVIRSDQGGSRNLFS